VVFQFDANAFIKAYIVGYPFDIKGFIWAVVLLTDTCNRYITDFWEYRPEGTAKYDNILGN